MSRIARVVLPGFPHHIIQRGHNRTPVFVEDDDYRFYLNTLAQWKALLGCRVYAFCLMTNHVHLVVDPGDDPRSLAALMKRLAARFTRRVNRLEQRTGTAWNGRFKSSPIETDAYLLACCRYVELNPSRAKIAADPAEYIWSSYGERIGSSRWTWLDEHPLQGEFGETQAERREAYRDWIRAAIPEGEWELIREATERNQLTGGNRFRELVEERTGMRVELRGRGRPSKKGTDLFFTEK